MGAAELGVALATLCSLVVGLLSWLGKGVVSDARAAEQRVHALELKVALLGKDVPEHGTRLVAVENVLSELKGDLRELKGDMHRVALWVESQSDPSQHRRSGDRKGD